MVFEQKIAELQKDGFCVLDAQLPGPLLEACRDAFQPTLLHHIANAERNRGPHRYFLPMPFTPPCFAPEFFFEPGILAIVYAILGDRIVADQWGCDAPVFGSEHQQPHVDYARPLFAELPDLQLPPYMLVVSFGLVPITSANGAIEIAPGTHCMTRAEAIHAFESGAIPLQAVPLALGDVLIRHPWAIHRGTPNNSPQPRPLLSIRYVRRWYADASREVCTIPLAVWQSLTTEQQAIMRFPVADGTL